jgi:1,4-dihydroxy-2-naphthoyl-CoA hydrolase
MPQDLMALMPFATGLGIELDSASAEEVVARMAWAPERCTTGGLLHGGALMTLADAAGALCAFLNLPPGAGTSTVETKTNFFRPVTAGHVHAATRPLHVGRRFVTVQTALTDDEGRLVAQTTQTQAVLQS